MLRPPLPGTQQQRLTRPAQDHACARSQRRCFRAPHGRHPHGARTRPATRREDPADTRSGERGAGGRRERERTPHRASTEGQSRKRDAAVAAGTRRSGGVTGDSGSLRATGRLPLTGPISRTAVAARAGLVAADEGSEFLGGMPPGRRGLRQRLAQARGRGHRWHLLGNQPPAPSPAHFPFSALREARQNQPHRLLLAHPGPAPPR